jgi:hypothetical protein
VDSAHQSGGDIYPDTGGERDDSGALQSVCSYLWVEASYPVGSFCEDKPSGCEEHLLEGQRLRLQPQSLQIEGDGREGRLPAQDPPGKALRQGLELLVERQLG